MDMIKLNLIHPKIQEWEHCMLLEEGFHSYNPSMSATTDCSVSNTDSLECP